jgi:hypothetical protein
MGGLADYPMFQEGENPMSRKGRDGPIDRIRDIAQSRANANRPAGVSLMLAVITMMACFLQIAIPFVWLGIVVALSFVETPLKFKAPDITLSLGLGIGRLVFAALNRIEVACAFVLLAAYLAGSANRAMSVFFGIIAVIKLLQTLWLLPALDERTVLVISGVTPPPSPLHLVFVVLEVVKVATLLGLGVVTARRWLKMTEPTKE